MTEIPYDGPGELHITDIEEAQTMDKSRFDVVITVCQDSIEDNVSDEQEYCYFNMSDGETGYGGRSDYDLFEEAATELYQALSADKCVLIHCHMGRSRSVSVATAAVARILEQTRAETYSIVRYYRPQAHPNQLLYDYVRRYICENTAAKNKRPFDNE
jgi:protein-tyrosine phosphatase